VRYVFPHPDAAGISTVYDEEEGEEAEMVRGH